MAKRQNFLIALFSVLLVLALGYISVYALYLYELTQRTFVLTYNLLEYLIAVPLAFFSTAALLCLVLLKRASCACKARPKRCCSGLPLCFLCCT